MMWACPQCGAVYGQHGTGTSARTMCRYPADVRRGCAGLRCFCWPSDYDHAFTRSRDCRKAHCQCCGWNGSIPKQEAT